MPTLIATLVILFIRVFVERGRKSADHSDAELGAWGAFVWFILGPLGVALLILCFTGQIYLLPIVAVIVTLLFPWPIARSMLIPLGLSRAAYWLVYTSDFTFRRDREGGAALAAAWALLHKHERDDATADWISERLAKGGTVRAAGVLAAGLLVVARGDRDGARALVETVHAIDEHASPPVARRLATSWLTADAASRGEWERVSTLAPWLRSGGRTTWLLAGVAEALRLGADAPSRFQLWMRWAIAPRRAATFPIVQRAFEALDGVFIEPDDDAPLRPDAPPSGDAWGRALGLHAAMLTRAGGALTSDDVRAVAGAWDEVLEDRATERMLIERALLIGASGATAALERMRASVEDDLAAVVLASGVPLKELDGRGEVATRVRIRLRDQLLTEVESASEALERRVDQKRELPVIDEWREWTALTRLYERGVASAGEDFRRLAFLKVHGDATSLAVWLYNERQQRPLANVMFKWLLAEAEATDDARAVALQTKNIGCGI